MTRLRKSLETLADRGLVRGADAVFRAVSAAPHLVLLDAEDGHEHSMQGHRRPRAWLSAGAAVATAAVLAIVVGTAGAPADHDVRTGAQGSVGPAGLGSGPAVLGFASVPSGYSIADATNSGGTSTPGGPAGRLRVFQHLTDDGTSADQVLAVAVSAPGEHTVLDYLTKPDPPATPELVAGRDVSRYAAEGPASAQFEVARWRADDGSTVTVAARGLDERLLTETLETLAARVGTLGPVPVPFGFAEVAVDPVRVPVTPGLAATRLTLVGSAGSTVHLGTESGDWPAAAALPWWSAGSHLTGPDRDVLATPSLAYRSAPGGAATAASPDLAMDEQVSLLELVREQPLDDWRTVVGDADRSDTNVATTEAPTAGGN